MLKSFLLAIVLFLSSILLMPVVGLSNPVPLKSFIIAEAPLSSQSSRSTPAPETNHLQPPAASETQVKGTNSSQPDELKSVPEKTPTASTPNQVPSETPQDLEPFSAFNRALYGS